MNNLFLVLYDVVQLRTKVLFGIVVILRESILAMVEKELAVINFYFKFSEYFTIGILAFGKHKWLIIMIIFTFTIIWNIVEKYLIKFKRWKCKLFWSMNKLPYSFQNEKSSKSPTLPSLRTIKIASLLRFWDRKTAV